MGWCIALHSSQHFAPSTRCPATSPPDATPPHGSAWIAPPLLQLLLRRTLGTTLYMGTPPKPFYLLVDTGSRWGTSAARPAAHARTWMLQNSTAERGLTIAQAACCIMPAAPCAFCSPHRSDVHVPAMGCGASCTSTTSPAYGYSPTASISAGALTCAACRSACASCACEPDGGCSYQNSYGEPDGRVRARAGSLTCHQLPYSNPHLCAAAHSAQW